MNKKQIEQFCFIMFCFLALYYAYTSMNVMTKLKDVELNNRISNLSLLFFLLPMCLWKFDLSILKNKFIFLMIITFGGLFINVVTFAFIQGNSFLRAFNLGVERILPCLTFIYVFLLLKRYGYDRFFEAMSFVCLFIILIFYYLQFKSANTFVKENFAGLSSAYISMLFLPVVMLSKKRSIRLIFFILVSLAVFSSTKRAGVFALMFSSATYLFIRYIIIEKTYSVLRRFLMVIFSISILILGYYFIDNFTDGYLSQRITNMEVDQGSGRLQIYEDVFDAIRKQNFDGLIFGNGYLSTQYVDAHGAGAHNDFLEVLYDCGIFLFIAYLMFHLHIIYTAWKLIRKKSYLAPILGMSYVQFLILSIFSQIVMCAFFLFLMFFLGVLYGLNDRNKEELKYDSLLN